MILLCIICTCSLCYYQLLSFAHDDIDDHVVSIAWLQPSVLRLPAESQIGARSLQMVITTKNTNNEGNNNNKNNTDIQIHFIVLTRLVIRRTCLLKLKHCMPTAYKFYRLRGLYRLKAYFGNDYGSCASDWTLPDILMLFNFKKLSALSKDHVLYLSDLLMASHYHQPAQHRRIQYHFLLYEIACVSVLYVPFIYIRTQSKCVHIISISLRIPL